MSLPEPLPTATALGLFSDYLRVTGVAHTGPEPEGDPRLVGHRLGLLNGSSWITLWATYFGRLYLPGVHLISAGNEAVQVNFMEAYAAGTVGVPRANISAFERYALDLVQLGRVDAVLITCSTMNRAYRRVSEALRPYGIPVQQIDRPMMARAVEQGGPVLVIATHGPTVTSTRALLDQVAGEVGRSVGSRGVLAEEAWTALAHGDVAGHNAILAALIRSETRTRPTGCVVLAQLSMSAFLLSHPDPLAEFGLPIYTSGQCGFEAMRETLTEMSQ